MPAYFFALQWPDGKLDDSHCALLPSDEEARAHASRVTRELKESGGFDDPALKMTVKDETGNVVCLFPF